jgi:RNA polymerase sigma factor (sigma-70 family)
MPYRMAKDEDIERAYREHGHLVLRRAEQILGDRDEAVDVMQELFTSLMNDPGQFAGRSRLTTWLYSATTHLCLNRIRDRKTRARILAHKVAPGLQGQSGPRAEHVAAVRELLARMPEDLARVTVYYYMDEMTHEEIAELVGCSRRQVGNLLERAHDFARKANAA